LEEVDSQAEQVVGGVEDHGSCLAFIAVIADQTADDGTVLLLDGGLVAFLVGSGAGDGDVLLLATVEPVGVDEGTVLSESMPNRGRGRLARMVCRAAKTSRWLR
jgi:hypothetical protein